MKKVLLVLSFALLAMTSVWAQMFSVDNLKYKITDPVNHCAVVIGYETKPEGVLNVPGKVNYNGTDYFVLSIENNAFLDCYKIVEVNLPSSVISIEEAAFKACSGVQKVTFPGTLTTLGKQAFMDCLSLNEISLGFSLGKIEESAFENCQELPKIKIPSSVRTIGNSAFRNCFMLKDVTFSEGLTTIGSYAFSDCKLSGLVLPKSLKDLSDNTFTNNLNMKEITVLTTLPPKLVASTFSNVKHNIPVYVPSSALAAYKATPYWEEFTNIQAYDPNRFNVDDLRYEITDESAKEVELVGAIVTLTGKLDIPTTVTHNDISYTVTSVGDEAFAFDSDLTELVFPHTVEYIGDHAFHYCTELTKITTYATVPPYVGTQAFAGADKEIPVIVPFNSINAYKAANGWSEFTNIRSTFVIDNLRLQLTDATAKEVSVVGYVMLPPTGKLEIPETVDYYGESYTITYIGDDSFADCTKLTELILPKTVTGVGARAFFDNAAFKRMTIHAVVPPFMGDEAFAAADFSTPLYVPEEGYDDYLNADGWKYFDVQVIQSSVSELTMPESIRVYGGRNAPQPRRTRCHRLRPHGTHRLRRLCHFRKPCGRCVCGTLQRSHWQSNVLIS